MRRRFYSIRALAEGVVRGAYAQGYLSQGKAKVRYRSRWTLDGAASSPKCSGMAPPHCQGITPFYLPPTHLSIYKRNEPHLPLGRGRGVATGWTGVDISTPVFPEVVLEIDANLQLGSVGE